MMFNCFLFRSLVSVGTDGKVRHIAKYAPERRLVPPSTLEKAKRKNQECDGQIFLATETGLDIANNNDSEGGVIWLVTEASNSGLKEIARVNVCHVSFGINRSWNGHGVGIIYGGRIPKLSATGASENIIVIN